MVVVVLGSAAKGVVGIMIVPVTDTILPASSRPLIKLTQLPASHKNSLGKIVTCKLNRYQILSLALF